MLREKEVEKREEGGRAVVRKRSKRNSVASSVKRVFKMGEGEGGLLGGKPQ